MLVALIIGAGLLLTLTVLLLSCCCAAARADRVMRRAEWSSRTMTKVPAGISAIAKRVVHNGLFQEDEQCHREFPQK